MSAAAAAKVEHEGNEERGQRARLSRSQHHVAKTQKRAGEIRHTKSRQKSARNQKRLKMFEGILGKVRSMKL